MGVQTGPLQRGALILGRLSAQDTRSWWNLHHLAEIGQEAAQKVCISRRRQAPMSSARRKFDFRSPKRETNQFDLRCSISAGNDHGGCPRWLWGASGRIFLECGQFLLVAPCRRGFAASLQRLLWNCEMPNVYRPQAKLAPSESIVVNLASSEHFGGRATPKPMVCGADNLNESRPSSQRLSGQIWSSLDLIDFGRTLSDRRDRFVA